MTSGIDPTAALASATAARGRGALAEALAAAEHALGCAPADPRAWLMRGSIAHLAGRLPAALADYRRALAVAPRDAAAHAALAVALAQTGQPATARAHLAAAIDAGASGGLGEVAWLRAFRQLRELAAADGATLAWERCATPLLRADVVSEWTCPPGPAGRRTWTPGELVAALRSRPRVVALTGAGLSAASGLCTRKELWTRFVRDEAVSAVRFRERPAALWTAIRAFWGAGGHAPNPAHRALATWPGLQAIVTQNVDGLHQAAGGQAPVIELHGSLERTHCLACGRPGASASALTEREPPPRCGTCEGTLRPEVVLFGEAVPAAAWAEARRLAADAELMLVVGCAMDVSPASELPLIAARAGARIVEIKRRPSRLSDAILVHHVAGAAEDVLPRVRAALDERG